MNDPWRFRPPPHPSIRAIEAFDDNYVWMVETPCGSAIVDPGDPAPVIEALDRSGQPLTVILLTHHHADHVGGVHALLARWPRARVIGPADERIAGVTEAVKDGDPINIPGLHTPWQVIEVPGHTRTHIAFFSRAVGADPRPVLFCGDALFAAGCGRLFEGTHEQMLASLRKLASLPADTLGYCAHEYTRSNLRFALAVEPHARLISRRDEEAVRIRAANEPTLPFCMADELLTNPFLRVDEPTVRAAAEQRLGHAPRDAVETFAALRDWKNVFR